MRLQVFLVVLLGVGALKVGKPFLMPLAASFFIAVLLWPLQCWLEKHIPRWAAFLVAFCALLSVFALAGGALYYSGVQIAGQSQEVIEKLDEEFGEWRDWAEKQGFTAPESSGGGGGDPLSVSHLRDEAVAFVKKTFGVIAVFAVVLSLLILFMADLRGYRNVVERKFSPIYADRIMKLIRAMAHKFRIYMAIITLTALITGVLTGVWCWLLGVKLAFVWGLIAFILNYVPTLGSIVAIIPPVAFSVVNGGLGEAALLVAGLIVIQLAMGNLIDPFLQGRSLAMSAFVALFAVVFWGWVWGIPGAFLGVPMTIVVIVMCLDFEPTRWVAYLLCGGEILKEGKTMEPEEVGRA